MAWAEAHQRFMISKCHDAERLADARYHGLEVRRRDAGGLRRVLFEALRAAGYGLRARAPFVLWVASMIVVVSSFSLATGVAFDPGGGRDAWERAGLLMLETLLLPAGILSLADDPSNTVLTISGTAARAARLAVSIPFASWLLALRARFRLPSFSSADL